MSDSTSISCVFAALVEVRKAYRLVWLYQQTLMDTYTQILRHLNVKHYYGELDPLQRGTNPVQKPPSTLLPLLGMNTLYLNDTGDPNQQKPGDYLVDIRHIGDTGYTDKGYPIESRSAYDASSDLWVYVFHATEASSVNWYGAIWSKTSYPEHDSTLISGGQPTIHVYGYRFDVATLTDPQAVASHMGHFKEQVKARLGLQL